MVQVDRTSPVGLEERIGIDSFQNAFQGAVDRWPLAVMEHQLRVGVAGFKHLDVPDAHQNILGTISKHCGLVAQEDPIHLCRWMLTSGDSLQAFLEAMGIHWLE